MIPPLVAAHKQRWPHTVYLSTRCPDLLNMPSGLSHDIVEVAEDAPGVQVSEKLGNFSAARSVAVEPPDAKADDGPNELQYPTEEELQTLRRVYGKIDRMIYIIGFVEMCERFAYYGTTAACK